MSPRYSVSVADLERGPLERAWPLPLDWLSEALDGTGAEPTAEGKAEVTLTLTGREVLVSGRLDAELEMPCAVTLDPVPLTVHADLSLLLSPAQPAVRVARQRKAPRANRPTTAADDAPSPPKGKRRQRDRGDTTSWADDPVLTDDDASRDTYDGERVVLDPLFREAILLELPMAPRRSDLPSGSDEATAQRSAGSAAANGPQLDPRLMPLAAIASRMRKNKE